MANIEVKEIEKSLPCVLTTEEKLAAASKMGKESQLYQEAVDRKKEVTTQLSAEVESHRASMQRLGSLLANGYEYRGVKCEVSIDREDDYVTVTRMDTGEVIESRHMRTEERQAPIQFPRSVD